MRKKPGTVTITTSSMASCDEHLLDINVKMNEQEKQEENDSC